MKALLQWPLPWGRNRERDKDIQQKVVKLLYCEVERTAAQEGTRKALNIEGRYHPVTQADPSKEWTHLSKKGSKWH